MLHVKHFDPLEFEERLEGWSTFWRWKLGLDQAASFEGQYRSPQHWDAAPIPPAQLDIDTDDVQAIESAVCALDLFHHTLLKLWYVRRKDEGSCLAEARRATGEKRRGKGNFQASLAMAKALLWTELSRPAVVRKQRASDYVRKLLGLEPLTCLAAAD